MNKSKLLKITFYILLFTFLISPCFGAWSQQEVTGNWDYYSDTAWKTQESDESWSTATLFYNQSVSNFTYWFFEHNVIDGYGHGWAVFDQDVEMETWYIIYNDVALENQKIWEVKIWFRGSKEFYITEDRYVVLEVRYIDNPNNHKELSYTSYRVPYIPFHSRIWIWRDNNNKLNVRVRIYDSDWELQIGKDLQYDVGASWYDNVVLEQHTYKWGCGWVQCSKTNESILTDEIQEPSIPEAPSEIIPFWKYLTTYVIEQWNKIGEAMPEPVKDFIGAIGGIFGTGWQIMTFAFTVTSKFVPYIGIFYMIYLVTVVMKCMDKTSINPLFEHIMDIWKLFASIVSMITGIVKTIWGFIKFW